MTTRACVTAIHAADNEHLDGQPAATRTASGNSDNIGSRDYPTLAPDRGGMLIAPTRKTMHSSLRVAFLAATVAGLLACTADPDGPMTEEIEADGKADGEISVRINGLTLWVDPAVTRASGARPWRLAGRTSRNLQRVSSFVTDDPFGEAAVRSARTFEISLDDHELNSIASGLPLFLALEPTTGAAATAAIWMAPRVGELTGTSRVRIDTTVTPRWVGGEVIYRGGARADAGWILSSDGTSAPQVFADAAPNRFRLDWNYDAFARGAR